MNSRCKEEQHTDSHSISVDIAHSTTLRPMNSNLFQTILWLFKSQHYRTRTQKTQAETFTDRITRAICSPVPVAQLKHPYRCVLCTCHTAVCLEFSFSFLGDWGIFLVNWLKLAALHLALVPSPPLSPANPCVGPEGRVL